MSKQTRGKKTSWRAKAMGALALAAAFGLPMGTALATDVTTGAWAVTEIEDGEVYNITGKATSNGITMDGGTLTVGNLIFDAAAITGLTPADGDLTFNADKQLTFTGGKIIADTISIGGSLEDALDLSQGGVPLADPNALTLRIGGTASTATNSISAKTLNYYAAAGMNTQQTTIELMDDGIFNVIPGDIATKVPDAYNGTTIRAYYDADPSTPGVQSLNSGLIMTGGKFNMDASGENLAGYGRLFEFSSIDISGGEVNIGGYYENADNSKSSTSLYGDQGDNAAFIIRDNAVVNLYDYGTISTFRGTTAAYDNNPSTEYSLDIKGGTINILGTEGKASMIRGVVGYGGTRDVPGTRGINGTINISGGEIKVGEGKYGIITSRVTDMSGGIFTVGGTIMAAGNIVFGTDGDFMADIKENNANSSYDDYIWGDFNFSGGTINISSTGLMDFATGNVRLNALGGTLNGNLALVDGTNGNMPSGDLTKGALYASEVIVASGKNFTVNALHVDQKAVADALTVAGKLTVNGALTTDAATTSGSIDIARGGVLLAKLAEVLDTDYKLDGSDNKGLATALTGSTGQVYLNSDDFTYKEADMNAALTALGLTAGQIVFTNGTLLNADDTVAEEERKGTETSGNVAVSAGGGSANNGLNIASSTQNSTAFTGVTIDNSVGNLNASTVTIDSTAVTKVTVDESNLLISGADSAAGDALVADKNGDAVKTLALQDGGALTLGVTESKKAQGGTVGDVEIAGSGGTLTVDDGNFSTGTIKTTGAVNGEVKIAVENSGNSTANTATTLTTQGIDLSTATGGVDVTVTKAAVTTNGGAVKVGGTASAGADNKLILTNVSELNTKGGDIVFGTTSGSGANILTVDTTSNLNAGNITFNNAAANTVTVADSDMTVKNITFGTGSNSTMAVTGGKLEAVNIIGDSTNSVKINVGDADKAGQLVAASVKNANLIVDPAFGPNIPSSTAIVGAISGVSTLVAQNSWALLGDTGVVAEAEAWMNAQIPGGKLDPDTYTAALAVRAPMLLNTGKELVVNGDGTLDDSYAFPNANKASFAAQSLFIVDAAGLRDSAGKTASAALEAETTGTAIVADSAALKIVGGKLGDTITVLNNFAVTVDKGWNNTTGTLLTDSALLDAKANPVAGNAFTVTMTRNGKDVTDILPELSSGLEGMVEAVLVNNYADDASKPGLTLLSDMFRNVGLDNNGDGKVDSNDINAAGYNAAEAVRTLEGMARIVAAAGVPTLAANLNTQISTLIVGHNSILNDVQPAYGSEPGQLGLWLSPFYGSSDVDGMKAGKFENGYEMNYGGAAFGMDYNISERFRLGLALNAGGGDSESEGDFNKTENDFDFWGLNLYSSYSNGAFGLTGDIGYTMLNSEITQKFRGNELNADSDSDIFTVGLTGEYKIALDAGFNVTPHAGLRYSKISTDSFDVELRNVGDVFEIDTDDQNLFQIPLGVKISSDIVTDGGWTVSPKADVGVLFTMGDTDVDSRLRVAGLPTGVTNTEVVDEVAFTGALGLQAKADNGLSLGLEYGLLAGGNQTDHQFSGMLRFEF